MNEMSTAGVLRIAATVVVLIAGTAVVVVLIRKHGVRWSANAGIGLGAGVIVLSVPLGCIISFRSYVPALVFLGLGVWALICGVRRRSLDETRTSRREAGSCESCGYDLTGNVSGVCPECGSPVDIDK